VLFVACLAGAFGDDQRATIYMCEMMGIDIKVLFGIAYFGGHDSDGSVISIRSYTMVWSAYQLRIYMFKSTQLYLVQ